MKNIKSFKLFESNSDREDFEEAKEVIKNWFDSYTDDVTEVNTGRLWFTSEGKCPNCKSSDTPVNLGYDYDSGRSHYQCIDCDWVATLDAFECELDLIMVSYAVWNKDLMNCITILDLESNMSSLDFITDKQIENLNYILKPLGYSYFEWSNTNSVLNKRTFNTITSLENIDKIKNRIESTHNNIQIFYPKNLLNESRITESKLQATSEIQEFLWKYYNDSPVIQFLSQLIYDEEATNTLNFLQVKENDWVYFSPDSKYPNTDWTKFDWEKQKLEAQSTKIGRIVKQLLPKNTDITDKDIEKFVNIWKSYFIGDNSIFEEVKGEKIKFWYSEKNYNPISYKNSLGKSCMSKSDKNWFEIYCQNPNVVSMIIQKDTENKLLSRALVWQTNIGPVLDKIYCTYDWNRQSILDFFKKQYPKGKSISSSSREDRPGDCYVELDKWNFVKTGYPYLDSFHYLDWETGKLWNVYPDSKKIIILRSTSGTYQVTNLVVFCDPLEDFIPRDIAYWDNSKKSWMPLSKFQRLRKRIKDWVNF